MFRLAGAMMVLSTTCSASNYLWSLWGAEYTREDTHETRESDTSDIEDGGDSEPSSERLGETLTETDLDTSSSEQDQHEYGGGHSMTDLPEAVNNPRKYSRGHSKGGKGYSSEQDPQSEKQNCCSKRCKWLTAAGITIALFGVAAVLIGQYSSRDTPYVAAPRGMPVCVKPQFHSTDHTNNDLTMVPRGEWSSAEREICSALDDEIGLGSVQGWISDPALKEIPICFKDSIPEVFLKSHDKTSEQFKDALIEKANEWWDGEGGKGKSFVKACPEDGKPRLDVEWPKAIHAHGSEYCGEYKKHDGEGTNDVIQMASKNDYCMRTCYDSEGGVTMDNTKDDCVGSGGSWTLNSTNTLKIWGHEVGHAMGLIHDDQVPTMMYTGDYWRQKENLAESPTEGSDRKRRNAIMLTRP